jgi:hypothetical protein
LKIGSRVRITCHSFLFGNSMGVVVGFDNYTAVNYRPRVKVKLDHMCSIGFFRKENLELVDSLPIRWQEVGF